MNNLEKLQNQFILTYKHHCPIEHDFIGDFNRLIWALEEQHYTTSVEDKNKLRKLETLINAVDRIVWSDQTASTASYEQAYNRVKRELLDALEEFRRK